MLTGYSRRSHPVPQNLKCTETEAEEGVTLKGGLKAGNFTDVGTVESIDSCTRLCCVSERCNLAMLINGHCFLVNCFSKELCKTVKTETKNYRPTVAFVRRWVTNVTEDTGMCGSALKVNATTSGQISGGGGGGGGGGGTENVWGGGGAGGGGGGGLVSKKFLSVIRASSFV